jgi:acetyl-CoA synthetase
MMEPASEFAQARDVLRRYREDSVGARAAFRWPRLEAFNWALDHFDVQAQGNDAPALWVVDDDGREARLSHRELSARSNRVANFLRAQGVRRGEPILIMLPNCVALWEVMLAGIKLGAVIIPATTLLTSGDIADRLQRGRVRHVVVATSETAKFAHLAGGYTRICAGTGPAAPGWANLDDARTASEAFRAEGVTRAMDPQLLYFTSGTTSKPKLVLHTQQSYPVGHLTTMYWIGLREGDVHWNISSPGWAKHAWSSFFAPWNAGATVFVYNYARFNAKAVLDTLVRCGVTTLCAPPTVWRMLIQEDLASYPVALRELVSAGEPLNPEVIDRVRTAWGITIRDGYGQTETTCVIGNAPGQAVKPGSMGRPMPGYDVVLLDPDGKAADEGEVALVLDPRPVGIMQGYADDSAKTAEATRGERYRTGDVAMRDGDGYYTYVGRADDVFKASDYRISPFELESVLIEHEAVAEAAVVPSPDPLRLAVPKCFVLLRAGHAPSRDVALSILEHARDRLAPYKRIRRLEFADLPKTISGKIRRVDLRRMEAARPGDARRPMEFWEEDLPELR